MGVALLLIVIFWVIFGCIGGAIDKQHPGRGFALGLFLGPLGLVIAVVLASAETKVDDAPTQPAVSLRPCPYCAEEIQPAAVVCRFCGRDVPVLQTVPASAYAQAPGWYPHPEFQGQDCFWDGETWTSKRRWSR